MGSSLHRKETMKEGTLKHQGRKEEHSKQNYGIEIKRPIYQEDTAIQNVYVPNKKKNYKLCIAKLIELKGETNKPTITVGDFNSLYQQIGRTKRLKITKDKEELNTINQEDLIDIYRTLHQMTTDYTFFQVPMDISQDRPCA